MALICAVAIAGIAGCAKQPAYKKLPKKPSAAPGKPVAPKQAPPSTEAPSQPTTPAAPTRTNARPSTEDVVTPQRQASMRLVERGKALMDAKDYGRAAGAFRDAVNVDTSNGVAYYYLAAADARLDQPDLAIGLLDKAEALLGADAEWMDKIDALRRELGAPETKPVVPSPLDKSF